MAESPRSMSLSPSRRAVRPRDRSGRLSSATEGWAGMELLSDFDPADQVSQLLRVIRIRSAIYCRSVMGAPWGFGVQAHGLPAFHVVTAGRCWLEVDGQPGQISLAAGDLVVL